MTKGRNRDAYMVHYEFEEKQKFETIQNSPFGIKFFGWMSCFVFWLPWESLAPGSSSRPPD
jgi:hypothetical protein